MAIQVVRAREKGPSTSAQFAQAFGNAIGDIGSSYFDAQRRKREKQEEEDKEKAVNKLVGKSISGDELTPEEQEKIPAKYQFEIGKLQKEARKTQASQPIDPDQMKRINYVRNSEGYEELSPAKKYQALTNAGVSKENAKEEADIYAKESELGQKSFESAYKANEDFINSTTQAARVYESETKPKLLQMQKIDTDNDLIGPTAAAFLETLGIPLGALEDPSSELYQKVSLDLLKGLPETYGNRIMKVEVDNFLKTIPTLLNSPEGRRMIASNMLKLGEMKEVFYNEMRRQQKKGIEKNKFPRDFQQSVYDQVKPQIDRISNDFVKMSEITHVPKDHVPFFSPAGNIEFVPKQHAQWAAENGGRRIW